MAVKYLNCRAWEVKALLAGAKTQTRRLVKDVPPMPEARCHPNNEQKHPAPYLDAYCSRRSSPENPRGMSNDWCWWQVDDRQCLPTFTVPYAPGDLLYVRECFATHPCAEGVVYQKGDGHPWGSPIYKATFGAALAPVCEGFTKWKSSIHMPKWASRLTLEVTDVRVQRVRDISPEDAIAEGIDRWMTVGEAREAGGLAWGGIPMRAPDDAVFWIADYDPKLAEDADRAITLNPIDAFLGRWDSLHGEGAWDRNDWVAAYSFTVHRCNIDDLLRQREAA